MDGAFAQLLALASHGNAWLRDPSDEPPDLLASNSTFRFVSTMRFELRGRWMRRSVWDEPGAWLRGLLERGTERLVLAGRDADNPDLANIGGAGPPRGAIAATAPGATEVWTARWSTDLEPGAAYPPDRRIWHVTYRGSSQRRSLPEAPTLDDARRELLSALDGIRGFARAQGLDGWAEWFDQAMGLAHSPEPEIPYHPDAIPHHATVQQKQLTAAAFKAWVFGGMGSWNDKLVSGPAAADEDAVVSERLYRAILGSLDAVTSAT